MNFEGQLILEITSVSVYVQTKNNFQEYFRYSWILEMTAKGFLNELKLRHCHVKPRDNDSM